MCPPCSARLSMNSGDSRDLWWEGEWCGVKDEAPPLPTLRVSRVRVRGPRTM